MSYGGGGGFMDSSYVGWELWDFSHQCWARLRSAKMKPKNPICFFQKKHTRKYWSHTFAIIKSFNFVRFFRGCISLNLVKTLEMWPRSIDGWWELATGCKIKGSDAQNCKLLIDMSNVCFFLCWDRHIIYLYPIYIRCIFETNIYDVYILNIHMHSNVEHTSPILKKGTALEPFGAMIVFRIRWISYGVAPPNIGAPWEIYIS